MGGGGDSGEKALLIILRCVGRVKGALVFGRHARLRGGWAAVVTEVERDSWTHRQVVSTRNAIMAVS